MQAHKKRIYFIFSKIKLKTTMGRKVGFWEWREVE
jgi:hypothetical protein